MFIPFTLFMNIIIYPLALNTFSIKDSDTPNETPSSVNQEKFYLNFNYSSETQKAILWLQTFHSRAQIYYNKLLLADWDHSTNLDVHTQNIKIQAKQNFTAFMLNISQEASKFNICSIEDYDVQRLIKKLHNFGKYTYRPVTIRQMEKLIAYMTTIYSTTKICAFYDYALNKSCNLKLDLEPGIEEIMARSRNPEELLYVWKMWTNNVGGAIREHFIKTMQLIEKIGFEDYGHVWKDHYETPYFETLIKDKMRKLMPFYELLHAYVRKYLHKLYGPEFINLRDPIPAHLLGNMWAQNWYNLYEDSIPYPNVSTINSIALKKKTPLQLFQMADDFFQTLGFEPMTQEFWNNSIFTKPSNGSLICHASAWDFFDGKDFRIKMCAESNYENFMIIHHEMGHIQYYMQYKHLPLPFRSGSNPGFHEAIGNLVALSVQTPDHLMRVGLLNPSFGENISYKADINLLYKIALREMAFVPFGFTVDLWRYKLFRREIKYCSMNKQWWHMRMKYQGIKSWEERTENAFDPGAKYHVAAFVPYMRYFVSFLLEFQFHEKLCQLAESQQPLHRCDISQSKVSGFALREMLKYGSSRPWQYIMKQFLGNSDLNPDAALNYFEPLINWLKRNLSDEYIGWGINWKAKCSLKSLLNVKFEISKSSRQHVNLSNGEVYAGDGIKLKCPLNHKFLSDADHLICGEDGKWEGNGCYSKDIPQCVLISQAGKTTTNRFATIFVFTLYCFYIFII